MKIRKLKTKNLKGNALDYAVAKCLKITSQYSSHYSPSTQWCYGGPIIEKWKCSLDYRPDGKWDARHGNDDNETVTEVIGAETPLIAAMKCFVIFHYGEEIEIPTNIKSI